MSAAPEQAAAPVAAATGPQLLRFATAGSVDDGKSTLIGRLLYDAKSLHADTIEQVQSASRGGELDLALLTDGLRAEREQGITIDVAYRHFATPRRRFIIADTPGHAQYTRNMVTGASTADLAIVLVDAREGLLTQSRRHAAIAGLLGIPRIVLAVNKMDLVDWDGDAFRHICGDFRGWASRLGVEELACIPISALLGDNVVERSPNLDWYGGPTLLQYLEDAPVAAGVAGGPLRLPVQWVIRDAASEHRGYAGQLASGTVRVGDEVVVLPSGVRTRVAGIDGPRGPVEEAAAPLSVAVSLEDELDVARGALIAPAGAPPRGAREIGATLCWLGDAQSKPRGRYLLKHTTTTVRTVLEEVHHTLEVDTLSERAGADCVGRNEIGRVTLRCSAELFFDPYAENRTTGSFILIDEATNDTVAAGLIDGGR
ncbi:MAG: bifunctional enzyme CysN/CysC [Solirubrobacteraceae bacterium]|nr:bifunctional enzyme CysN/CysC [Solirubrobacteraceae bacterium]